MRWLSITLASKLTHKRVSKRRKKALALAVTQRSTPQREAARALALRRLLFGMYCWRCR